MADDLTRERACRGLLIPDRRLDASALWPEKSSYDQAGPRPGIPVAERDTEMALRAEGEQPAGHSLEIRTVRGGFPEPTGAAFVWRRPGEPWRGWDFPRSISGRETIIANSNPRGYRHPHAVRLADDTMVLTHEHALEVKRRRVIVRRRNPGMLTWAAREVYSELHDGDYLHPCLLALPSGDLLLFHWDHGLSWTPRVRVHRDEGAEGSWEVLTESALSVPFGAATEGRRLRAAFLDEQLLLIVSLASDDMYVYQYASDDYGSTFHGVGSFEGAFPDLAVVDGRFLLGYVDAENGAPVFRHSESAFEPFGNSPAKSFTDFAFMPDVAAGQGPAGGEFTDGDMALAVDDDGSVYALFTDHGALDRHAQVVRSADGGRNWRAPDSEEVEKGVWWRTGSADCPAPIGYCAVACGGRLVVFHNGSGGLRARSIGALYLGGYTTVPLPALDSYQAPVRQAGWRQNWFPFDLPDKGPWTPQSSGGGVPAPWIMGNSLGDHLRLNPNDGQTLSYRQEMTSDDDQGLIVRFAVEVLWGHARVTLHHESGGVKSRIEIEIGSDRLTIFDLGTLADAGGVAQQLLAERRKLVDDLAFDPATPDRGLQIMAALRGSSAAVWYRPNHATTDHRWTELVVADDLGDTVASAGDSFLEWGAVGRANTLWFEFHASWGSETGVQLAGGIEEPEDLFPRAYSPRAAYVADGVRVAAVDGPTRQGDSWRIETAYEYPIHDALPSVAPSPRRPWRSSKATRGMSIGLRLGGAGESLLGSDLLGLYLDCINWREGTLQGFRAGVWQHLLDFEATSECMMRRLGTTVVPTDGAGRSGPYLQYGELAGGTLEFVDSKILRPIVGNTEGNLMAFGEGRTATIHLGELSGLESPQEQLMRVWYPRVLVLEPLLGKEYEGFRLVLHKNAGTPAPRAGYYQIGVLALGHVALFGWDYSRGRILSREANVDLKTFADGARRSRRRGPSRRSVEFAWAEGVDVSPAQGEGAPDYLRGALATGAEPVAARHDTPFLVDGLVDALDGPHRPLVYLPRIDTGAAPVAKALGPVTIPPGPKPPPATPENVHTWQRARGAIYGRLTSPVRLENVLGEEESGEVLRVANVTIEEEV
ncbi:MAG: hypothetical protein GY719_13345 [bacterium]|nr:hypothetical protein [bacterium]